MLVLGRDDEFEFQDIEGEREVCWRKFVVDFVLKYIIPYISKNSVVLRKYSVGGIYVFKHKCIPSLTQNKHDYKKEWILNFIKKFQTKHAIAFKSIEIQIHLNVNTSTNSKSYKKNPIIQTAPKCFLSI